VSSGTIDIYKMSLEGAHLHSIQYRYTWEGTAKLKETIDALRHQDLSQPCQPEPGVAGRKLSDRPAQQPSSISAAGVAERKEKSLGLLAQRFVQMLLCVTDGQAVALEDAAKSLLGVLITLLPIS